VKVAVNPAGDCAAANEVVHVTVSDGLTVDGVGNDAQPEIGLPALTKATVPTGATLGGSAVTVASKVTLSFVTGRFVAETRPSVTAVRNVVLVAFWVRTDG
jgi:hypothetical protein